MAHEQQKEALAKEEAELARILELSKAEAATLQQDRKIVTQVSSAPTWIL